MHNVLAGLSERIKKLADESTASMSNTANNNNNNNNNKL